jgi:23S rRNA pseudouridine955/2504/2580 synthase
MFLHAFRVVLTHPISGEALSIEAPLPANCAAMLGALRDA